jgi:signal transduction histidine kinase
MKHSTMMKFAAVASLCVALPGASWAAEDFATAKEAEAIVAKAVAHIKSAGSDTAYADFTQKKPGWVDRDLYVVVYDMKGTVRAHGQNPKMVGKDLIDLKDADGKAFVKERVELAQAKGKFWQEYKFTDPVTKKILPKSMYCEKLQDTAVCAGIYKR